MEEFHMFHAGCENRLYMSSQIQVLHRLVVERLYKKCFTNEIQRGSTRKDIFFFEKQSESAP